MKSNLKIQKTHFEDRVSISRCKMAPLKEADACSSSDDASRSTSEIFLTLPFDLFPFDLAPLLVDTGVARKSVSSVKADV